MAMLDVIGLLFCGDVMVVEALPISMERIIEEVSLCHRGEGRVVSEIK
jgi:hypothetical protein